MQTVIAARAITRYYGDRLALDAFTLDVPAGSIFGLLGPNGSGKSTFMALVAAAEAPTSGELAILGSPPSRLLRARIGTVFQENASDPLLTPAEYLRFAGRLFGLGGSGLDEEIPRLLGRFGLGARAAEPIAQLSGGMRRRLEVARALLHHPEILLMDEPTTGVDPDERRILWETVLADRGSVTVLVATNDLAEADAVCDRVAFLQAGRVVAAGTPAELKQDLRRESIRVNWPAVTPVQASAIAALSGAGEVTLAEDTLLVTADDASDLVPRIFALAHGAIRSITIEPASLEDAYFQHVRRREAAV